MLQAAILKYGYAMIFVSAAFEGDASLLTGAFLAHRGYFDLTSVMVIAGLATVTINQFYFWMARTRGRALIQRRLSSVKGPAWLTRALTAPGTLLLLVSRFVYGFRIAIPVASGASAISPAAFALADLAGATIWAIVMAQVGFSIGRVLTVVVDDLRPYEWWIAAVILVAGLVVLGVRGDWRVMRLMSRRRQPSDVTRAGTGE